MSIRTSNIQHAPTDAFFFQKADCAYRRTTAAEKEVDSVGEEKFRSTDDDFEVSAAPER